MTLQEVFQAYKTMTKGLDTIGLVRCEVCNHDLIDHGMHQARCYIEGCKCRKFCPIRFTYRDIWETGRMVLFTNKGRGVWYDEETKTYRSVR